MLLYDIGNNSVLCGRIVRPIFMQRRSETAVDLTNALRWRNEIWILNFVLNLKFESQSLATLIGNSNPAPRIHSGSKRQYVEQKWQPIERDNPLLSY